MKGEEGEERGGRVIASRAAPREGDARALVPVVIICCLTYELGSSWVTSPLAGDLICESGSLLSICSSAW